MNSYELFKMTVECKIKFNSETQRSSVFVFDTLVKSICLPRKPCLLLTNSMGPEWQIRMQINYLIVCSKVKLWITLNEPWIMSVMGYAIGVFSPGTRSPGVAVYQVGHNLIKAHAEAWHTYDSEFRSTQKGEN